MGDLSTPPPFYMHRSPKMFVFVFLGFFYNYVHPIQVMGGTRGSVLQSKSHRLGLDVEKVVVNP